MNKYTRSYPHIRKSKPEFRKTNIALLIGLAILLTLQLNAVL